MRASDSNPNIRVLGQTFFCGSAGETARRYGCFWVVVGVRCHVVRFAHHLPTGYESLERTQRKRRFGRFWPENAIAREAG